MSWSRRILLIGCMALAGCGFRPIYGERPDGGMAEMLNRVDIANVPDRNGQILRNLLIDRFYTAGHAPQQEDYQLRIALSATERKMGLRKDETATRTQLNMRARFDLVDLKTGTPVYSSTSQTRVSYNLLDAQFATLATEDFAYRRGLVQLADDIRTRVALYFAREPEPAVESVSDIVIE